jgi:predicted DNA-binding transcriptional regulator AlpA
MVDQILTSSEAAEILGIPLATLRWWRHRGIGPKSFKLGPRKVMYKRSDVIAWLEVQYRAAPTRAGGGDAA